MPRGLSSHSAACAEACTPYAVAAVEQRGVEVALQGADATADSGGGDADLLGRSRESLAARDGLEEAQAFKWGQV